MFFLVLITAARGPNSRHNERQIKDEQYELELPTKACEKSSYGSSWGRGGSVATAVRGACAHPTCWFPALSSACGLLAGTCQQLVGAARKPRHWVDPGLKINQENDEPRSVHWLGLKKACRDSTEGLSRVAGTWKRRSLHHCSCPGRSCRAGGSVCSIVTFGVRNEGSALQNLQNSSSGSSKGMAELLPALTIALPLQAQ